MKEEHEGPGKEQREGKKRQPKEPTQPQVLTNLIFFLTSN